MTWEGVVTIHHKRYMRELGMPLNVEAYIQSLRKLLKASHSIEDVISSKGMIMRMVSRKHIKINDAPKAQTTQEIA
jgi:hypothetical protein